MGIEYRLPRGGNKSIEGFRFVHETAGRYAHNNPTETYFYHYINTKGESSSVICEFTGGMGQPSLEVKVASPVNSPQLRREIIHKIKKLIPYVEWG